jgi:hypothetical protein
MPFTPKIDHNTILEAYKRVDTSLTPGSFYWAVALAEKINKPLNICLVCSGHGLTMEGGVWDCTGWVGGIRVNCPACLGVGSFETAAAAKEAEKKYEDEHNL